MDQIQNKARMTHKGALRSMQMMINAQRKKWELFDQEQVGRQLIASVLLFINEVELLIYRFLSSGVKNSKRYPRPVELWVDRITSRWTLNALTSYRCLDRSSTGARPNLDRSSTKPRPGRVWTSTGKRRLLDERECFLTLLDQSSTEQGQPVDRFPNRLSQLAITSTGWAFWPRKPSFWNSFLFYYLGKVFKWINMLVLKHFA